MVYLLAAEWQNGNPGLIELRTIMAQVIDSPSAPIKSPLTSSEIYAETGATVQSSRSAREDEQDLERCVLDMDASRAYMVSHIGDCNLECSYCAIRWSARRILTEREE